jgi:hypothetical protein
VVRPRGKEREKHPFFDKQSQFAERKTVGEQGRPADQKLLLLLLLILKCIFFADSCDCSLGDRGARWSALSAFPFSSEKQGQSVVLSKASSDQ